MTALHTQTPVEIDTKLAELYFAEAKARDKRNRIQRSLQEARIAKEQGNPCYTPYSEADVITADGELRAIIEEILPYDAEYERRPWQRYWHVSNVNGHIHTSQSCSSCYPDTRYGWRVDLSGLRDTEVVEREAYNACSVCMPIAPAEQKAARVAYNKEQREAKAAERQAKRDAKDAKAAERASKLVDKAEKEIAKLGGIEVFKEAYSLYGHDGRKSVYDATFDMQATVGHVLYDLKSYEESNGQISWHSNIWVRTELKKRGLIF